MSTSSARAMFSVVLTHQQGARWCWVVTCERCGVDLSDDYSRQPVTVMRVEGFHDLLAMDRNSAERMVREFRLLWQQAQQDGLPMVMDKSTELDTVPSCDLQRILLEHAQTCNLK